MVHAALCIFPNTTDPSSVLSALKAQATECAFWAQSVSGISPLLLGLLLSPLVPSLGGVSFHLLASFSNDYGCICNSNHYL